MPSTQPTQAEVLRERASRVPWRRAIGDVIRGMAGRGPMVLPDRLEGAVVGHLLGAGRAGGPGEALLDALEARLDALEAQLDPLEAGLGGSPDRAAAMRPLPDAAPDGGAGAALAAALVERDAPAHALVELVVQATGQGAADESSSAILYALVVRRLLGGERSWGSALAAARREADASDARHTQATGPSGLPPAFAAAWSAVDGAHEPADVLQRISAAADPRSVAIAGGLAGARWGSSAIPVTLRETLDTATRARRAIDRLVETDTPGGDGDRWRTSTSDPLEVHELDLGGLVRPVRGSIGITPLPGRRYVAYHTGAHWRDLDADIVRLRELGIGLLFLLVEDSELARCRVRDIGDVLARHGVELLRFPVRDPLVPRDGAGFRAAVAGALEAAMAGRRVALACRGGFDRAGMTAACLLREAGLDGPESIARVQHARPGALALPDQQAYVRAWPPSS